MQVAQRVRQRGLRGDRRLNRSGATGTVLALIERQAQHLGQGARLERGGPRWLVVVLARVDALHSELHGLDQSCGDQRAVVVDHVTASGQAVTITAQVVRAHAQAGGSGAGAPEQVDAQLGGDRPHAAGAATVVFGAEPRVDQNRQTACREASSRVDELVTNRLMPGDGAVAGTGLFEGDAQAGLRADVQRFSHSATLTRVLVSARPVGRTPSLSHTATASARTMDECP